MSNRKYTTEEERREARRRRDRERKELIQQLMAEYRRQYAERTELRQRQNWEATLRHPDTRRLIISLLLKNHYEEIRTAVEAWRLLKIDQA